MSYKNILRIPKIILIAAMTAITTILVCYLIATYNHHYPVEKVVLPFISLTGYKAPEYYLYVLGFCTTGILFIYCSYYIHFIILPITELFRKRQLKQLFWILTSGVLFFMLHAVIPLQDDMVTAESTNMWSKIHQSSAGIFFMLVIIHTVYVIVIVKNKPSANEYLDKRGRTIRLGCVIGSCITVVIAMVIHPTTRALFGNNNGSIMASVGALAQWILVGSIIIIFTSYSMDIQKILPRIYEKETRQQDEHVVSI